MKIKIFLLLFGILLFSSCQSSKDEPAEEPLIPEEILPVNDLNLIGTWQVYNYTKKVDEYNRVRILDIDGAMVTFLGNGNFYESNAKGVKNYDGKYEIISADMLKFTFPLFNLDGEKRKDTVTQKRVVQLSTKGFTFVDNYIYNKHTVSDLVYYRNMITMPDAHPGVSKERITVDRLQGTWKITAYQQFINATLQTTPEAIAEKEKRIGTVFQYGYDRTFTERVKDGVVTTEGTFTIMDDVVHMFFKGKLDEKTDPDMKYRELSSSFQIIDWKTENNVEKFTVFESYTRFPDNFPVLHQRYQYMERVK